MYDFLHICLFMWTNVTILFSQISHLNDCLFGWTQLCFFTSFILRRFPHLRHGNLWKPRFPQIFCRDHISSRKIPMIFFHLLLPSPIVLSSFIIDCLAPNSLVRSVITCIQNFYEFIIIYSFLLMIDGILRYTCYLIPLLLAEHLCHLHNHL